MRMFVDEGAAMRRLLAESSVQLAARGRTGGEPDAARLLAYVERLLAAFPDAGATPEDARGRHSSAAAGTTASAHKG